MKSWSLGAYLLWSEEKQAEMDWYPKEEKRGKELINEQFDLDQFRPNFLTFDLL